MRLKRIGFKAAAIAVVAAYFALPFRMELGDVLHDVSHYCESVIDQISTLGKSENHTHRDHDHQHHHHAHEHGGHHHHHGHYHDHQSSHGEDHSHGFLTFITQWLDDAAPDNQDNQNEYLKFDFDKHFKPQTSADSKQLIAIVEDLRFFFHAPLLKGFQTTEGRPPEITNKG